MLKGFQQVQSKEWLISTKNVMVKNMPQDDNRLKKLYWLPFLVLFVNLGTLGLVVTYSSLNLRPFLPSHDSSQLQPYRMFFFYSSFIVPTVASVIYLWPIFDWLRTKRSKLSEGKGVDTLPPIIVRRAGNAPVFLGSFSLLSWVLVDIFLFFRVLSIFSEITASMWAHFFIRPLLGGMIAFSAIYFVAEYICRTHIWPFIFSEENLAEVRGLWNVRVVHRLIFLWLAISFLPLSVVALTGFIRMDVLGASSDPIIFQVVLVIILIAVSAGSGGAFLAWVVSRSIDGPLRILEHAMEKLRGGDFNVRMKVSGTDEIGTLEVGFNQMAHRLSESYEALESRNRELAEALERVEFLESVKRGLDRFVPDTVRRLIEEDPMAPTLQKSPRDVTVLFLDIQGYSRLSERFPREVLTELVEKYFSIFLTDIRREGGDINETAGDGLMILFQEGEPEEHAVSAVRVALAIKEKTTAANRDFEGVYPHISINVGISSGECDVGVTRFQSGAIDRWTFTATGPVTNIAARIGDLARDGQILLAQETAQRVHGSCRLNNLGLHVLKNISEQVEVWEVEG